MVYVCWENKFTTSTTTRFTSAIFRHRSSYIPEIMYVFSLVLIFTFPPVVLDTFITLVVFVFVAFVGTKSIWIQKGMWDERCSWSDEESIEDTV